MGVRESAGARVDALPDAVLSVVTSVSRLPEWNPAITEVVEAPERLEPGTVWRVRIHALGQSWVSKSEVVALDASARRFAYRSQSDDGNPSYADWEWHVVPDGDGSRVTVTVDLNPLTFWRKHLLIRVRRPALRKEMQNSLAALGSAVAG
jgi:Polyketide cyclase / dehydrase and lipid transport